MERRIGSSTKKEAIRISRRSAKIEPRIQSVALESERKNAAALPRGFRVLREAAGERWTSIARVEKGNRHATVAKLLGRNGREANVSVAAEAPLLAGERLSKVYRLGPTLVPGVRDVSFSIFRGEFVALQGPSGSGKTTLLNLLGLLDRPDEGAIRIAGEDTGSLSENERSDLRRDRFGFVFQTFNLIPVLSAEENVAYPMVLGGVRAARRRERARELLASVGLAEKAGVRPDLLSGGQRQRVAIARALANGPSVVFADEPTANLDSHTAEEILDLMRGICGARGVAFLFATHDPRVVARARRVVALRDGHIESDRVCAP